MRSTLDSVPRFTIATDECGVGIITPGVMSSNVPYSLLLPFGAQYSSANELVRWPTVLLLTMSAVGLAKSPSRRPLGEPPIAH